MLKLKKQVFVCAALFLFAAAGFAKTQVIKEAKEGYPPVTKAVLDNGLRVLILENKTAPVVALRTFFKTGNADCESGKTGVAHLLEHMAFKGSETVGTSDYAKEKKILDEMDIVAQRLNAERDKGVNANAETVEKLKRELNLLEEKAAKYVEENELQKTLDGLGARGLNAYTSADVTAYIVSLPSNRLEAWFMIEADRFKNPVFRGFYKERDVVLEEMRMGQNRANTMLYHKMISLAFEASPYRNPVIGWQSDVERLLRKDAQAFYAKHYSAENAVAVIVGDVNTAEVIKLAEKYFGGLKGAKKNEAYVTKDPKRLGMRRAEVEFDANSTLFIAYNKPTFYDKDDAVLEVAAAVLSDGRTGRLYKNLVEKKQVALWAQADAATPGIRYDNLFMFAAAPKAPYGVLDCEKAINEEIEKLKTEPVAKAELDKVVKNMEAAAINSMTSNENLASMLGTGEVITGNWRYEWDKIEAVRKVTPQDIQNAAKKYFVPTNASVVWIKPIGAAAKGESK